MGEPAQTGGSQTRGSLICQTSVLTDLLATLNIWAHRAFPEVVLCPPRSSAPNATICGGRFTALTCGCGVPSLELACLQIESLSSDATGTSVHSLITPAGLVFSTTAQKMFPTIVFPSVLVFDYVGKQPHIDTFHGFSHFDSHSTVPSSYTFYIFSTFWPISLWIKLNILRLYEIEQPTFVAHLQHIFGSRIWEHN